MQSQSAFERLKTTVLNFALSKQPGAMLVHGPWGVGKTHAVHEALRAENDTDQLAFSYISLYGISSLDEIYTRLSLGWMNKVSSKVPDWLASKIETAKGSRIGQSSVDIIEKIAPIFIGKEKFDAISASTAGLLVRNMLVVFDDLERKTPEFDIRAILGVTSYLAESRECRVIFITNDDAIEEEEKRVFDAQKEKVFDFEVPYSPTVEENAAIFAGRYKDYILPVLLDLGIRNLRVIRRATRALEMLDSKIPANCNLSRISLLTSAGRIGALYLGFREKIELSHLRDTSSLEVAQYLESEKGDAATLTDGDRLIMLSKFTDGPCDDHIIEVIKSGETDWAEFAKKAQDMQEHHEAAVANSDLEKFLRSFFENYSRNDENLAEHIKTECDKSLLLLKPGTIDWAAQILVDLDQADYREDWFGRWAAVNMSKISDKDIRHVLEGIESVPKQLKAAYATEAERRQPAINIEDVLFARLTQQPYLTSQIDQIAEFSVENYVSWIMESRNENLRLIIRDVFSHFYKRQGAEGIIAEKTLQAVDLLAGKSLLNKLRAKYLKSALPKKGDASTTRK